eukprot:1681590-Pyramimonas_sp.AAC.1
MKRGLLGGSLIHGLFHEMLIIMKRGLLRGSLIHGLFHEMLAIIERGVLRGYYTWAKQSVVPTQPFSMLLAHLLPTASSCLNQSPARWFRCTLM